MLMTRWQPFTDPWGTDLWGKMSQFRDEMDRLFESFGLRNDGWPTLAVAYPAVNIWEDNDHVYAEAELPGMELNELEIYVTGGNQLTMQLFIEQLYIPFMQHQQDVFGINGKK